MTLTNGHILFNLLFQLLAFLIQKYDSFALVAVKAGRGVIFWFD